MNSVQMMLLLCVVFLHNFVSVKALVGHNVRQALPQEFRFIAGITKRVDVIQPERDVLCTASLISNHDVLTAAHCVVNEETNAIQIIVGSIDLNCNSKYYPAWWITYDQWASVRQLNNQHFINDIAIIRLTGYVPVRIPSAIISYIPYQELIDAEVIGVGWGEVNNGSIPTMLQTTKLRILEKAECEARASRLNGSPLVIPSNILCSSGNPFTAIMLGDSGGPLLYMHTIIALNIGTCPLPQQTHHPDKVNLHANMYYFQNFVSEILGLG